MMKLFRSASQAADHEARAVHDAAAARRRFAKVAASSPRAALAFSALSACAWLAEKLGGLARRIAIRRTKPQVPGKADPAIYVVKSVIHFCAALLLFSFLCTALHAQQAGSPSTAAAVVGGPSAANRTADEETLRKLNETLLTAHDHADVATLDRIEADDFTIAGDFGTVAKKAHLARLRAPAYKTEAVDRKITPQDIRLYGDVALISETDHAHTADGTFDFQTTSVWVRVGESWRVVHMHYSALTKKQEASARP